ncbi:MAG: tetratricopeptide repeat protein [Nitrospirae bacterium]|nr:tetratricopeptide repeat protein [Nitrospirota bacterium]
MSLLADLLSKVKHDGFKGDVPPNLKQVVADSAKRSANTRKVVLLSVLMLVAVITGFGSVYLLKTFVKPAPVPPVASFPQPGDAAKTASPAVTTPAPPPIPAVTASAAATAPSQSEPAAQVKPGHKKSPSAKTKPLPSSSTEDQTPPAQEGQDKSPAVKAHKHAIKETASSPKEQKQTGQPAGEEIEKKDMYLYAAKASEARKDYQQALANYKRALDADPASSGNYIIMNNIAGIMIQRGLYDEALRYAGNALIIKEDYVPCLVNMGIASIKLNDTKEGEKYLSKALALDSSNRNALINLALLHEKTAEYDKAYSLYYKMAELGDIRGYFGLARIAEKKGSNPDAARIYREILSMNNLDPALRKMADDRLSQLEK